jgi:cardiolipin synthase (CMP-forming)
MKPESQEKKNFKNTWNRFFRKEDVFLVPNILCYIRVLLIIAFTVCYLIHFSINGNNLAHIYISCGLMMVAAYTDFIDGYIARTYHQQSELGKVLDPVADKLMQFAISLVILVHNYQRISVILMFAIFIAKEFTLFLQDVFMARRDTAFNGAKWYGKVSSFVFYVVTIFVLLGVPIIEEINPDNFVTKINILVDSCCYTACFFLVLAWILYFFLFLKLMKKAKMASLEKPKEEKDD